MSSTSTGTELPYYPETSMEYLGQRKSVLYISKLEAYFEWMRTSGKDDGNGLREPMTEHGAANYVRRLDQIFRFFWNRESHQIVKLSHSQADAFIDFLRNNTFCKRGGGEYSSTSKRKFSNTLKKYFEWQSHEKGGEPWTPEVRFTDGDYNIPDYFEREELQRLREAAYDYGSIPNYNSLSPEERDRWKGELAQRLEKPKADVTANDWEHVNTTWKFTSIMLLSQDAGLRPCEVHDASVDWLRLDKQSIAIPKEESSKDRNNWEVAIRDDTAEVLRRWKQERQSNPKYDDTDALWLNRSGNRYNSKTLNYFLRNLFEEMGFDTENRQLSWYSIRHGIATFMSEQEDISMAKEQLRHRSIQTTQKYVHPSLEARRDSLDSL
jgi:site-specific recombinase XerD